MDAIRSAVLLEGVSTKTLRGPCKVNGYINMVLFGFIAVYCHIAHIVMMLTLHPSPSIILYAIWDYEQSWMVCRSLSSYFLIKGVRENKLEYIIPIIVDSINQLIVLLLEVIWRTFEYNWKIEPVSLVNPNWVTRFAASLILHIPMLLFVGNYYIRLRKGNLQDDS